MMAEAEPMSHLSGPGGRYLAHVHFSSSERKFPGYQDEEAIRRQAASNYVQSGHYQEAMNVLSSLKEEMLSGIICQRLPIWDLGIM